MTQIPFSVEPPTGTPDVPRAPYRQAPLRVWGIAFAAIVIVSYLVPQLYSALGGSLERSLEEQARVTVQARLSLTGLQLEEQQLTQQLDRNRSQQAQAQQVLQQAQQAMDKLTHDALQTPPPQKK